MTQTHGSIPANQNAGQSGKSTTATITTTPLALDGNDNYGTYDLSLQATVTINFSNVPARGTCVIIILNNDATPRIVTFGTGFRTSGTITGTALTASNITFISNGTSLLETARILALL